MDLRDLYQQVILDHNRSPRNFGKLEGLPCRQAEGFNPVCGDRYTVYLRVDEAGVISDIAFDGGGCAISKASASLMTDVVKGQPVEEAEALFGRVRAMLTSTGDDAAPPARLEPLEGVRAFPTRVKCASLAWHAMSAALRDSAPTVSTEE